MPETRQADHLHITRLRLDAALYEEAPPRKPHQKGRPRLKGERLPNLSVVAKDPATVWRPITVANWYGAKERAVEVVSDTAIWYSTGLPAVPVRWVLIRDPEEEFKTQALLCTDLMGAATATAATIVLHNAITLLSQSEGCLDSGPITATT